MEPITLENGLRIVFLPRKECYSTYVSISINCGAFYPIQKPGLAHMLEHNIFSHINDNDDINNIFSKLGTRVEAFTNDFNTTYSVRTVPAFCEKALFNLLKLVYHANFNKNYFNNEKKIIYAEFKKRKSETSASNAFCAYEGYYSSTFISKSNIGIGNKKQINNITFENLQDFYKNYYKYENSVIVIAGNFNKNKVLKLLKEELNNTEKLEKQPILYHIDDIGFHLNKNIVKMIRRKTSFLPVELVLRGSNYINIREYIAYELISIILCSGSTSSILKKKLREEMNIIYDCDCVTDGSILYKDCGTMSIRYSTDKKNIIVSLNEILRILKEITPAAIKKYLIEAKLMLINNYFIRFDDIEVLANLNAINLIFSNDLYDCENIINCIENIRYDEVYAALRKSVDGFKSLSIYGYDNNKTIEKVLNN